MRVTPSTGRPHRGRSLKRSLQMPQVGHTLQRGISLMEALVAMVVLALGMMGLAGVQMRLLTESRTANARATAVSLIDDLTNRMLLNREGAMAKVNPATANSYALAWGETKAAQDCLTAVCTAAQLAQSDLNLWLINVAASLPGANATVFQSPNDPRQLGIAIAWTANEGKAGQTGETDSTKYNNPFNITAAANGVACPAGSICHLVYVQP